MGCRRGRRRRDSVAKETSVQFERFFFEKPRFYSSQLSVLPQSVQLPLRRARTCASLCPRNRQHERRRRARGGPPRPSRPTRAFVVARLVRLFRESSRAIPKRKVQKKQHRHKRGVRRGGGARDEGNFPRYLRHARRQCAAEVFRRGCAVKENRNHQRQDIRGRALRGCGAVPTIVARRRVFAGRQVPQGFANPARAERRREDERETR